MGSGPPPARVTAESAGRSWIRFRFRVRAACPERAAPIRLGALVGSSLRAGSSAASRRVSVPVSVSVSVSERTIVAVERHLGTGTETGAGTGTTLGRAHSQR